MNLEYEAVLLEFRMFPHVEFILRNNILKLGNKWSFTIICGKLNYEYMKTLCKSVSPYIKIINVEFENLLPSEYSLYLSGKPFWSLLKGRKVLIYQEDSIIFKTNIDQFLYYDYIGAPWPTEYNGNISIVGNGTIVKGITNATLENVLVPTPPLQVQSEIVSILDNFIELIESLEKEILSLKTQYEYYRNKLLVFKELDVA